VGDDGSATPMTVEACVGDSGGATQGRAMVKAQVVVKAMSLPIMHRMGIERPLELSLLRSIPISLCRTQRGEYVTKKLAPGCSQPKVHSNECLY
jgi:hypothetical protein